MSHFIIAQVEQVLRETWGLLPFIIALVWVGSNASIPLSKISKRDQTLPMPMIQYISLPEAKTAERNEIIGIVIPGTFNQKHLCDNTRYCTEAKYLFASLFGGYTAFPNLQGGWILEETGELIEEPGFFVCAWTTPDERKTNTVIIEQFALYLKEELKQEAVSVIINGNLKFI